MTPSKALHGFAVLAAVCAFLLLIAGALVTSTGSGLAVPDWPLSHGSLFPRMEGGVFFEHGHRLAAGAVALLTWTLAGWTWLAEAPAAARRLSAAAAGGILAQAVLGGLTVLLGLPPLISIAHACLGPLVFCLLVSVAQTTAPCYQGAGAGSGSVAWAAAAAAVYIQLALGAAVRHGGHAVFWHVLWAFATAAILWRLCYLVFQRPAVSAGLLLPAGLIAALVPIQMFLGLAAYLSRQGVAGAAWAVAWRTGHVACGTALLGVAVIMAWRSRRA